MEFAKARRLVESVVTVEDAYQALLRVGRSDQADQDDVIVVADRYKTAILRRNEAFDGAGVALGDRGSGVVSDTPHIPPEMHNPPTIPQTATGPGSADGTVQPGAAEETREAGQEAPTEGAFEQRGTPVPGGTMTGGQGQPTPEEAAAREKEREAAQREAAAQEGEGSVKEGSVGEGRAEGAPPPATGEPGQAGREGTTGGSGA